VDALIGLACATPERVAAGPRDVPEGAIVVATVSSDYATGALAVLDPVTRTLADGLVSTSGDPAVDAGDGVVYEVNRFTWDTVAVRSTDDLAAVRLEFGTGAGTNPQGVVASGGRLWVPLYERAEIGLFDPVTGALHDVVDLLPWADDDGLPEVGAAVPLGGAVVAPVQRLHRAAGWVAADDGAVLAFDGLTGALVGERVVGPNPRVATIPSASDRVGVVVAGAAGGVYEIDPVGSVMDLRLSAADVSGEAFAAAWDGSGTVIALGHDEAWTWTWVCVDALGTITAGEAVGNFLSAVETDGTGGAWIAARTGFSGTGDSGGLWRVDLQTCAVTDRLAPALPPFDLVRR
jgi:hypothetical protein